MAKPIVSDGYFHLYVDMPGSTPVVSFVALAGLLVAALKLAGHDQAQAFISNDGCDRQWIELNGLYLSRGLQRGKQIANRVCCEYGKDRRPSLKSSTKDANA